jgi:Zn-dependent protease with chaperone function
LAVLAAGLATLSANGQAPAVRHALAVRQALGSGQTGAAATSVPARTKGSQAYTLPPDKLAKAIALDRIRDSLGIVDSIWSIVVLWLLLATRIAGRLERWAERIADKRWVQGMVFFAALLLITAAAGLPLDMIGHHYGRAYGIGLQGWGSWFGDQGKALGLTLGVGVPVLLLFNWIVRRWPRRYWLIAWVVTLPILVGSVLIEPLFEPMFEKFEPLQKNHPTLVAELEKVVSRTGTDIPPDRMYLMKASLKTNGLNAYVSGMGATKRIVVWDTTADRVPDDEVLFLFGHESGHYVLHHLPKGIACYSIALFFVYWACAGFASWMVRRFGVRWGAAELSSRAGFVVLLFAISLAGFLLEPATNAVSRHFEHQADIYGQEAIHGIVADPQKTAVAAFNALGEAWLEDPNPNPVIEFWLSSHPSTARRAEFAMHYDPWVNGGHGEFFKN